jgi:5'-phosphate synthase pdxT subunit
MIQIGVLALQGAFIEHRKKLEALGVNTFEIRKLEDLNKQMDGLILPGGESTAMRKLLDELKLFGPIKQMIDAGLPTLGTCAGLILLSKSLKGKDIAHFQAIDIETERNAYGRQLGSFKTNAKFDGVEIPMTFIRAPYISHTGKNVKVLSTVDGKIVAARENHVLVTAFHPEITDSNHVHLYFLQMIHSVTI